MCSKLSRNHFRLLPSVLLEALYPRTFPNVFNLQNIEAFWTKFLAIMFPVPDFMGYKISPLPEYNPRFKRIFAFFCFEPDLDTKVWMPPAAKRLRHSNIASSRNPIHVLQIWADKSREPLKLSAELFNVKGLGQCHRGNVICRGKHFTTKVYFSSKQEAQRAVADVAGWWLAYGSQIQDWGTGAVS